MSAKRKRSAPRPERRERLTGGDPVDYRSATKEGCSSGKWGWLERSGARTLSKSLKKKGGKGVREYECPECGRWHVGHLPFETRRGHRTAREFYGTE